MAPQTSLTDETGRVVFRGTQSPGGGSLPARNVGQAEFDFTGFNPSGHVPLAFSDGDATMVNLTDPTYPKIIVPGIYAYTVTVLGLGLNAPGSANLLVDDNYYSINILDGPSLQLDRALSMSPWFCDANDPFQLTLTGDAGDSVNGRLFVQKIA